MGAKHSKHCVENIEDLKKETGFNENELEKLRTRFFQLDVGKKDYLVRADLLRIKELTINPLGDRILHLLFNYAKSDMITFAQFVNILAIFRPFDRNTTEKSVNSKKRKIEFVFRLFDLDGDTIITTKELANILQMVMGNQLTINQVKYITENMMFQDIDTSNRFLNFSKFYDIMASSFTEDDLSIHF
ncbi:calcineurin B homologous protein 1-like [Octopus bimaculoides]|uniref:EF-hand domain-containing protein n=1 Tax=Octopus bimaculoides TaxID=37653 RepID=A0A0L8HLW4_OCTBM|nr:calcineurin B homologous protein 1-like [Octopus bimaculoides]